MKKLALILLALVSLGTVTLSLRSPLVLADATSTAQSQICAGANQGNSDSSGGCTDTSSLNSIITAVVDVMSIIVGIVAVIMIIFGGFKYITSAGDTGKITSARNTIVYAVVGLVIVALAQIIVQFVLNRVTNSGS